MGGMCILILGGAAFLGRALAEAAMAAGHTVTVFNRGRFGADPNGAEAIRGDRESVADLKWLVASGPGDLVLDLLAAVSRGPTLGGTEASKSL